MGEIMATDSVNALNGLGQTGTSTTSSPKAASTKNQVGKDEFMQLLVTQLKNQDPLNPMDNQQFAVQLAQFSQLEQLTSINQKIGANQNDISGLTSYLGKEVTLQSDQVHVEGGQGGLIKFDLPTDTNGVTVQLMNSDGTVAAQGDLGSLKAGKQTVALQGLSAANGDYAVKVLAKGIAGGQTEPAVKAAGVVSGLVPGADPTLMIGGRAVKPSDITEVGLPSGSN